MMDSKRLAEIEKLEGKIIDAHNEYVRALRKGKSERDIYAIYIRIQKLQQKKQELKKVD